MSLKAYFDKYKTEAGCDEAGRGSLAGPVFAAAVILPKDFKSDLLTDSKMLSEKKRYFLRGEIIKHAIDWAVAYVDNETIDRINILNSAILAMHMALDKLSVVPELILVDGNKFKKWRNAEYKTIVKGDSKYFSIAAASVLAKTFRDDFMKELHKKYPVYFWAKNKGYATKQHKNAVLKFGLSPFHRKRFCNFYFEKKLF